MKKLVTSLALLSALGAGVVTMPAHAQLYEDEYLTEYETGLWETDDWANDTYGVYDEDFGWETAEAGWDTWYGDTETAWGAYDDIGEGAYTTGGYGYGEGGYGEGGYGEGGYGEEEDEGWLDF